MMDEMSELRARCADMEAALTVVGRCSLPTSKSVLKARLVSALETKM